MNVFNLAAKITLDTSEYEQNLEESKKKSSTFGDVLKATLTSQAIISGVKTLATAVKNVGQAALEGYADFEQLKGGVDTLFGEESAKTVIKNAETAYKTAGLSANAYLETVTSFSASLLQSLGGDTEAAAEYADLAVTDMADNANKMGSSMESIQNAYQGFAKQNFTMLDNLKLGYGGTKEEMERLIEDANRVKVANGEMADLSIDSFGDIVEAIHIVQDEMGIAGATADEAEGTISGAAAAMKGAWTNLVTGLADGNADVNSLLNEFLGSVETLGTNVIPVVKTILTNIGKTFEENGPEMIAQGALMLAKLAAGIIEAIPGLIAKIPQVVKAIAEEFKERGPEFLDIGKNIVQGIWNGISAMASWIKTKVSGFLGGIVSSAKSVLGIQSPSKVFAGIGKFMAEGLGEGWDDQYKTVKSQIESGLSFDAGEVAVERSESSQLLRFAERFFEGARNSLFGGELLPITVIAQSVLDGEVIAENVTRVQAELKRAGGLA